MVDGDSIQWDAAKMLLRFAVFDSGSPSGGERLDVVYQGLRPDMLRDGATAILEGKLNAEGIFEARTLLLSCPSKYQAAATATAAR
jgi:cytochrome c-type biogenesis protein CcmE